MPTPTVATKEVAKLRGTGLSRLRATQPTFPSGNFKYIQDRDAVSTRLAQVMAKLAAAGITDLDAAGKLVLPQGQLVIGPGLMAGDPSVTAPVGSVPLTPSDS